LLVLLGVALTLYISESIPHATIQRDAGAAVIGSVVCIALVVLWEMNGLALRSPIIRKDIAARGTPDAPSSARREPLFQRRVMLTQILWGTS
jgi:hypothetical protein